MSEGGLIERLRGAGGKPLSGSRLAQALGMTRAAVHKQVQKLRRSGYEVKGTNRVGYRLGSSPRALAPDAFKGGWGDPFFHHKTLPSTQDEAKRLALKGAAEGTLVAADRQTAGRGRLGRRWVSPAGGLWFSIILRPTLRPGQVPALVLVAALDWARAIRETTGLPAQVKWPNDVWVEGRKVAGLLADMSSELDRVHWVVLGAGVNVNNRPPALSRVPAGSLAALAGKAVSRQDLLARWLGFFSQSCRRYQREGFAGFHKEYEALSLLKGRVVEFDAPRPGRGRVLGVDGEGRLLLDGPGGPRPYGEGEVRLRKP